MSIKGVITLLGSAQGVEREKDDLYTTDPVATKKLLDAYNFSKVWECAAGLRDMSKIFDAKGILSKESDLHSRDLVDSIDFLTYSGGWDGDIVTNPPYKHALEFVKKANSLCAPNYRKVAMLLRLQFLEGIERGEYFEHHPPTLVMPFSRRIKCYQGGKKDTSSPAMAFAWFIWDHSIEGRQTLIKWL
jgi:hypothetical protein